LIAAVEDPRSVVEVLGRAAARRLQGGEQLGGLLPAPVITFAERAVLRRALGRDVGVLAAILGVQLGEGGRAIDRRQGQLAWGVAHLLRG
jgi:hypothetical protein